MITTNDFCKKEYGQKLYKISFNAGFTCPNRDGSLDTRGCIFCSKGGSGDFAVDISGYNLRIGSRYGKDRESDIQIPIEYSDAEEAFDEELEDKLSLAKSKVKGKYKGDKYIAYFQAFTNTYADADSLRRIYEPVIKRDDIAVLSIATRPDCLNDEIYELLAELNSIKPIWVELGFQTSRKKSIEFIRRGYDNEIYDRAVKRLNRIGIHTITHVILYLPGETVEDMLRTVKHVVKARSKGIKLQLLHVLKGTELAQIYQEKAFKIPTLEEYVETVKKCVDILPEDMVVHRLTGDAPKRLLIAPEWSADKKKVINAVNDRINPPKPYYVYMIRCSDGSFYTGSTNDVWARFDKHSSGKGAKYTRSHGAEELIYVEECAGKNRALSREYEVKHLTRDKKEKLLKSEVNIIENYELLCETTKMQKY